MARQDKTTKALMERARKRFKRALDAESTRRKHWREAWKFGILSQQWDDRVLKQRELENRPALTVNKLAQHIRQVTNDIRQNRPAIKVLPVDDRADLETAEMLTGLCRHIYQSSDGELATDTAAEHAVVGGWGYFRVLTEQYDADSNLQDICIKRIANPLCVYLDPSATDPTGCDARWGFITDKMSEDEYKEQYKGNPADWPDADEWRCWQEDDKVIIAEYFERDGDTVTWYKLSAEKPLETTEWAGKYVPIIRVIGNESQVDGETDYWGLVRPAMDSQKLYNLWTTAEAEVVALMPKAPYKMPVGGDEGFEHEWKRANSSNQAVLHYNAFTESGQPLPPPQREQPPIPPAGIIQAKLGAADDIKAVTGQYDASLGARSNETSGKAILARQREGDTSTFHYMDNVARSIRQLGKILIDLIPKIYDTERIARILGEDNSVKTVRLMPGMPQAVAEHQDAAGKLEKLYNPTVGRYDVISSTGPSYTTKRQEAFDAMQSLTQASPQLMGIIGDLMVKSMDWPGADEMAKRLKAMLPQQLQEEEGQAPIPPQAMAQMQQMQQAMQQMDQVIQKLSDEADGKRIEAQKLHIDAYNAETNRLKAEADVALKMQAQSTDLAAEIAEVKVLLLDIMRNAGHLDGVETPATEPTVDDGLMPESPMQ